MMEFRLHSGGAFATWNSMPNVIMPNAAAAIGSRINSAASAVSSAAPGTAR
jgi:hypothetical protein